MLFHKMEKRDWPALKTFLVFLNYLPEDERVDIPLDENIVQKLREL